MTNLKTFVQWTGASSASTGLATGLWALVWVQLIFVAVRAEQTRASDRGSEGD
ncbi:MAG TPA: hypothetical protein VEX15_21270 [Nocardioidaceae bacterium]|nr:hypothetical protein [Nocardioidaceae bacterium]